MGLGSKLVGAIFPEFRCVASFMVFSLHPTKFINRVYTECIRPYDLKSYSLYQTNSLLNILEAHMYMAQMTIKRNLLSDDNKTEDEIDGAEVVGR